MATPEDPISSDGWASGQRTHAAGRRETNCLADDTRSALPLDQQVEPGPIAPTSACWSRSCAISRTVPGEAGRDMPT